MRRGGLTWNCFGDIAERVGGTKAWVAEMRDNEISVVCCVCWASGLYIAEKGEEPQGARAKGVSEL